MEITEGQKSEQIKDLKKEVVREGERLRKERNELDICCKKERK